MSDGNACTNRHHPRGVCRAMIRNIRHERDELRIKPLSCWAETLKAAWPYRNINALLARDKYGKSL